MRMAHFFIRTSGWKKPGAAVAFVLDDVLSCGDSGFLVASQMPTSWCLFPLPGRRTRHFVHVLKDVGNQ